MYKLLECHELEVHSHRYRSGAPQNVVISNPDVLILLPINYSMDYSRGVLNTMCSPFFPDLREDLGP